MREEYRQAIEKASKILGEISDHFIIGLNMPNEKPDFVAVTPMKYSLDGQLSLVLALILEIARDNEASVDECINTLKNATAELYMNNFREELRRKKEAK